MKIVETYSHLNGLEFLLVHQPALWEELKAVVRMWMPRSARVRQGRGVPAVPLVIVGVDA